MDSGTGTGTDPGADTATDTTTDTGSDTESDTGMDSGTGTGTDTTTDTGADTETDERCVPSHGCVVYVDGQNADVLIQNGNSWETAYSTVQDGIDAAFGLGIGAPCEVRLAQGTYLPTGHLEEESELEPGSVEEVRSRSVVLRSGVQLLGGYSANPNTPCQRDIVNFPTVLSGDNQMDDSGGNTADNAYSVVWAKESGELNGLTVTGGHADHSSADSYRTGGGLHIVPQVFVKIVDCRFTDNYASYKGGAVFTSWQSGYVSVRTTYENNSGGFGGAIYNEGDAAMLDNKAIVNNRFINNRAFTDGGAIFNQEDSIVSITGTLFSQNLARNPVYEDTGRGGAICNVTPESVTITNCTIVSNDAYLGGGIFNSGHGMVHIYNSILWDNTQTVGFQLANSQSTPTIAYSIVQDGNLGPANDTDTLSGVEVSQEDPMFADTELTLSEDSPAINNGHNDFLPADSWDLDTDSNTDEPLPWDVGGEIRIIDTDVDLGAFEFQGAD